MGQSNLYFSSSLSYFILGLSSYTSKYFFCTSKISLNSQKILWPFKEIHGHHTPKIYSEYRLPKIKIYDFRKSKYITRSRLPEVKLYRWKSTSESQNISLEFDFQKSKYITRSRLPEVKMYHQKSTSGSQKLLSEVDLRKSKKHCRKSKN